MVNRFEVKVCTELFENASSQGQFLASKLVAAAIVRLLAGGAHDFGIGLTNLMERAGTKWKAQGEREANKGADGQDQQTARKE